MQDDKQHNAGDAYVELNCSTFQLKGSSVSHLADGGKRFRCQCGPLSELEIAALERAAEKGTSVRLVFPESHILLAHVAFERVVTMEGWVAISGRVVDALRPTKNF